MSGKLSEYIDADPLDGSEFIDVTQVDIMAISGFSSRKITVDDLKVFIGNIYNKDDTLTSDRVVSMDQHFLQINEGSYFQVDNANRGLYYDFASRNGALGTNSPAAKWQVENDNIAKSITLLKDSVGGDVYELTDSGQVILATKEWVEYNSAGSRFDVGDASASIDLNGTSVRVINNMRINEIYSKDTTLTGIQLSNFKNKNLCKPSAGTPQEHHIWDVNDGGGTITNSGGVLYLFQEDGGQIIKVKPGGSMIIGQGDPDASALLEVSSTTKGLLLTPMTGAQAAIIPPSEGLILTVSDNTDVTFNQIGLWCYENGAWAKK